MNVLVGLLVTLCVAFWALFAYALQQGQLEDEALAAAALLTVLVFLAAFVGEEK